MSDSEVTKMIVASALVACGAALVVVALAL